MRGPVANSLIVKIGCPTSDPKTHVTRLSSSSIGTNVILDPGGRAGQNGTNLGKKLDSDDDRESVIETKSKSFSIQSGSQDNIFTSSFASSWHLGKKQPLL